MDCVVGDHIVLLAVGYVNLVPGRPALQTVVLVEAVQPGTDLGTVPLHFSIGPYHIRRIDLAKGCHFFGVGARFPGGEVAHDVQEGVLASFDGQFGVCKPSVDKLFGLVAAHLFLGESLEVACYDDQVRIYHFRVLVIVFHELRPLRGSFSGERGPEPYGVLEPLRGLGVVPFGKIQGGDGALRTAPIVGVSFGCQGYAVLPHHFQRCHGAVGQLPGHMEGGAAAVVLFCEVDAPFLQVRFNDGGVPHSLDGHKHQALGRGPFREEEGLVGMEREGFYLVGSSSLFVVGEGDAAAHCGLSAIYRFAYIIKVLIFMLFIRISLYFQNIFY